MQRRDATGKLMVAAGEGRTCWRGMMVHLMDVERGRKGMV